MQNVKKYKMSQFDRVKSLSQNKSKVWAVTNLLKRQIIVKR